ncbi:MAG: NAD-dependent epimerase/dehydratase family protein [Pseudomonadota bacterium]
MTSRPSVLILGARGRFGQAATHAFASAGWRVLAQRRSTGIATQAVPHVHWLDMPVHDAAAVCQAAGHADVVVHAMNPVYTDAAWKREVPAQMEAAIAIARGLGSLLMFPGNVYNFGAGMPAVLREDTPWHPTNAKGSARVVAEKRLRDVADLHGLSSVVVRAGDFFGSGTGSLFDRVLASKLTRGRMGYPAGLDIPTAWAYLPDLAQTFVQLAQRRDTLQGAHSFHFRGHPLTGQDWRDALTPLARAQGWLAADAPLRLDALPWPLIRAAGLVLPTWRSLVSTRYIWNTPHMLDNRRLLERIGAEPHTPLSQAAQQSLADMGLLTHVPPPRLAT